jgi:hypothetical protein
MNKELQPVDQRFPLPYDAYAAFDALTLKQLMIQRLNENGVFTDQIYEGSNFNNFIDVIAYSYNILLFYLNKTSNESLFATSQIYENMNKIVKLLNYNPVGYQTSLMRFDASSTANLPQGIYTIPKYSYVNINDIKYSTIKDINFVKATDGPEFLGSLGEENYLAQGSFFEYPPYVATGEPFEQFTLTIVNIDGVNETIDHNSIDVYVRNENGEWEQWTRVESIYLGNGNDRIFECRLDENLRYTLKFGNNVTGKQLTLGTVVAVYYLKTDLERGEVGANTLNGGKIVPYNTPRYAEIMQTVRDPNATVITFEQLAEIGLTNPIATTKYGDVETTDQIRVNAPNLYKAQGRLVTTGDFEAFTKARFSNIIHDVTVVNNWEYLDGHVKYLYNIGLKSPTENSRVLFNQIQYADSCNFNNVYIYAVPKVFGTNSLKKDSSYLNSTAKQQLLLEYNKLKLTTIEPVIMDPVYTAIGLGLRRGINDDTDTVQQIMSETKLYIQKLNNNFTNDRSIKEKIIQIFLNHFENSKVTLGMVVDLDKISQDILAIPGVSSIFTTRKTGDYDVTTVGLGLVLFNPVYSQIAEDVTFTTQNTRLPYFKIPFIFDIKEIEKNIVIIGPDYVDSSTREY